MWDSKTGTEVRITPFGSKDPYQEYKAKSTSELYAGDRNECYIEAVDNERYTVELSVPLIFQWEKARCLRLRYNLDGGMITQRATLRKPKEREALTHQASDFEAYVDGAYRVCGFTFGPVDMVDDPSFLTQDEEEAELSARGKIQVVLQRGKTKDRKMTKKEKRARQASEPCEKLFLSSETNKKVAGDKGRSHFTRPMVLETVSRETTLHNTWREWIPAENEAGQEITFTFYYTTRMYLERENIVSWITYPTTRENAIDIEQYTPGQHATIIASPQPTPEPRQSNVDGRTFVTTGKKRIKIEGETEQQVTGSAQVSGCTNAFHHGSGCNGDRPDCNVSHDQDQDEPLPRKHIAIAAAPTDVNDRDMYSATPGPSRSAAALSFMRVLRDTSATEATDPSGIGSRSGSDEEEEDDDEDDSEDFDDAPSRASAARSSVTVAGPSSTATSREQRRAEIADELREIELRRQLRAIDQSG
ncbi:hypothetical protein LTR36_000389 [Oleoguttula mirabilis]|uniref:DUF7918 domain-containing protein n=1 Tax=Oleoguttula mirabilis TaxID=1507867 RepID=A0AAV9JYS3_9PEZI|nr:hypothetical protein LTR36_000389 [Oleoguttula mirabilis]